MITGYNKTKGATCKVGRRQRLCKKKSLNSDEGKENTASLFAREESEVMLIDTLLGLEARCKLLSVAPATGQRD
jgi:hypothetical protein